MRRRDFVRGFGIAAGVWPLAAVAQQGAVPGQVLIQRLLNTDSASASVLTPSLHLPGNVVIEQILRYSLVAMV
jgi:hypothetical protein